MRTKDAEIIKILKPYFMAFPKSGMDEGGLMVYARALSPLEIEDINAAMLKLLRTQKFWPSVSEIFDAAKSIRNYIEHGSQPSPAEAWEEVMSLARRWGIYKKWEYSCPEVEKAAKCFGREALCLMEEKEVNYARAQFMKIYKDLCDRANEKRENEEILATLSNRRALKEAAGKVIQLAEAKTIKEAEA